MRYTAGNYQLDRLELSATDSVRRSLLGSMVALLSPQDHVEICMPVLVNFGTCLIISTRIGIAPGSHMASEFDLSVLGPQQLVAVAHAE